MAREIGPKCKVCRRMGEKLFLKGEKCLSDKCVLGKRGEEETKRGRKKLSPYSIQLKEKQKLKTIYGIPETQLRIFFERASKTKGDTIVNLLSSLERRLDNVIYRLGFADSRASARQLIQHGHVAVNQRKIDIPSFLVSQNQTITVRNERASKLVKMVLANKDTTSAAWLSLDKDNLRGQVLNLPSSEDLKAMPFNAQLIVELFSK
ncbi:MAG: 30S ribosomal protein S4 [bacterium]|nr:30S ribosomal protein S4 [candidate division WOR-3 bacterium]MDH5683707.1 30S ribosomal protein S4 [candidate division WOR-3 bacterium]